MDTFRRFGLRCGVAIPFLSLTATLLATVVDPSFSWTGDALSNLGELPPGETLSPVLLTTEPEFVLFNTGLVVSGLLGVPFAIVVFDEALNSLERFGACLFGFSLISLAGVGIFFLPRPEHGLVAQSYFISAMVALLVLGAGMARDGRRRTGIATLGLGFGYAVSWVGILVLGATEGYGIAIPEFVGAILLSSWALGYASYRLWGDRLPEHLRAHVHDSSERVPET